MVERCRLSQTRDCREWYKEDPRSVDRMPSVDGKSTVGGIDEMPVVDAMSSGGGMPSGLCGWNALCGLKVHLGWNRPSVGIGPMIKTVAYYMDRNGGNVNLIIQYLRQTRGWK